MRKNLAAIGLAAGLTAGAAAGLVVGVPGISGAQSDTPGAEAPDRSAGRADRLAEVLGPLVEDGTLTQAQLDAVIARLGEELPPPGGPRGHGMGPGSGPMDLESVAEAIGIPPEELRDSLRDGRTLAEVAGEHGVDVQVVVDAIVDQIEAHLAEKVADGDLTQEEADERLGDASEKVTERVTNPPERPSEGGRSLRSGRPGGPGLL